MPTCPLRFALLNVLGSVEQIDGVVKEEGSGQMEAWKKAVL
jgi:hypothetical protein